MRTKNQTMNNLERYIVFMREKGYEVQTLRKYQGTEYAPREIKHKLDMNGIFRAINGRAAPDQMHVAERLNGTIT